MPRCSVGHCRNTRRSTKYKEINGITFHRFPKDPVIRKLWLNACRLEDFQIRKESVVCSTHFEKDCYTPTACKRLYPLSVPTLNLKCFDPANLICSRPRKRKLTSDDYYQANNYKQETVIRIKIIKTQNLEKPTENRVAHLTNSTLGYDKNNTKIVLTNIEDVLKVLKVKFKMQVEDLQCLKYTNVTEKIFSNQIKGIEVLKQRFPGNLRSFALTLHYLSPKAYSFFRKSFCNVLPLSCILNKIFYSKKGEPGFTKESFAELGYKADTLAFPILATLVIGEMSIRRCVEIYNNKTEGYIDVGTGLEGGHLPEAKKVLVFLVTAINSNFKIPVGYFLVDKIIAEQRAELIKQCLRKVQKTGIKIVALSMKGVSTDLSTAEYLGCSLKERIIKFEHPISNSPVIVLWDLCHMVKLLLNSFRLYKTFLDKHGNKVEWRYVDELDKITNKRYKKYEIANNLGRDKYFKIEKIKSKLKSYPFTSASIEAMHYFRKELKVETLKGSKPTQHFLTVINNIVDVFTFKSLNNRGLRHALDGESIYQFIDEAVNYIVNLKTENGTVLTRTFYKTGSLGVLGCLEALKHLLIRLSPSNDNVMYLPLYKLYPKQLELFLYNIKTYCKSDYPTAKQCKYAYKTFLFDILKVDIAGNRKILQDVTLLNYTSAVDRINKTTIYDGEVNEFEFKDKFDITIEKAIKCINSVSEYYDEAITYIVTYVTRYLLKVIVCDECVEALTKICNDVVYPSNDVVTICRITELNLNMFRGEQKEIMVAKIMQQFIGTEIFDSIYYHQLGVFPTSNHVTDLMKAVVEEYINIRIDVK